MMDSDDFPEDEIEYYQLLLDESTAVGIAMIESKDIEEQSRLVERYRELQELLDSFSFASNYTYND